MSKELIHQNIMQNSSGSEKYSSSNLILGFILVLAMVLRFYDLGTESYWLDEVATTVEARQSIHQLLTVGRLDQPPAYLIPLHFWLQVLGDSEASLRLFSAIAGMGSIILLYLIGRHLFGKEVGLLSAFLMAISEFQISISQEARNYGLFEFAILLSFFFLIQFVQSRRMLHLALYGISSMLMVNSNAYGVFILVGQNLFFALQLMRSKNVIISWVVCQALILLAVIPYLSPLLLGNNGVAGAIDQNLFGVPPPLFSDLLRSVYRFMLPPRRYFGMDMEWSDSLTVIYALAGVLLVIGTLITLIRQGKSNWLSAARGVPVGLLQVPDLKSNLILLGCWLLCPLILPFIISQITAPIYSHKYVIGAAPALYLFLALGLFSIRKIVPLAVGLGVLMILAVPGLGLYYVSATKEQWREVATFIEESGGQNEVVMLAPNDSGANTVDQLQAFNYYYQGNLPSCGIGPDELTDNQAWVALKQCTTGYDRFWVIIRHTTDSNVSRYESFFLSPNQTSFHLIKEKQFLQITVFLFEMKK